MSRYIPMPAYPDMMPVDISFVFADEKPAGKHGFIRTVSAPGSTQRAQQAHPQTGGTGKDLARKPGAGF